MLLNLSMKFVNVTNVVVNLLTKQQTNGRNQFFEWGRIQEKREEEIIVVKPRLQFLVHRLYFIYFHHNPFACVCASMSNIVAHFVLRISLDEIVIGLDMLTRPFAVPFLFCMWFFCCILGQCVQFWSFFTRFSSTPILRILFFVKRLNITRVKLKIIGFIF